MVSLMPRYWRSQPASATHNPPASAPARHTITVPARFVGSGTAWASAAQARPPSTSAPSPPITVRPARAGIATHKAVSISGAARCSVFCHEYQSPKAPLNSSTQTSTGLTPENETMRPNSSRDTPMAPTGRRMLRMATEPSDGTVHAFDQVVHFFEFQVGLLERLAGRNDGGALVVLERAFEDVEAAGHHLRLHAIGLFLGGVGHHGAVGRGLDETFLQSAAHEVGMRLAAAHRINEGGVGGEPVPFGAGEVGLGRELGLAGVVTADHLAALGRGLPDHLWAVHVHGEHVHALVGQAVGGLGFLDRHRPVAGEDHAAGDLGVDRPRTHGECVDVAQHLRDRLGGDEADLLALAHVPGDHAVEVLALIDVAEEAGRVLRVFAFGT